MEIELTPKLLSGEVVQITEISVKIELKGKMGMINLPRRSVITDTPPAVGDAAEMYISYAKISKPQT